ncbi:hypothetical protein M501DRAFT_985364 [Patellaria atrata CBS 101060]|uniref:DUF788-domain-containing protein n=1 Tax=Patellaria atrata CBS 101060 TaxID=1346257 RepID=A0A9P4VWZ3_9PEZI|nr:hypothetical protein M501DRAFT_985364 [Patellaria atrata CBS 101060]
MAQKAAKTLAVRNTTTLNRTLVIAGSIHGLFILLRMLFFYRSFTRRSLFLYVLLSFPALFIQFWFERMGRPVYLNMSTGNTELSAKGNKELKRSGEDLEARGLTEWMWDVFYWSYGCIGLAAIVGDYAWWLWTIIPLYSLWLAYTTFIGAKQGMAGLTGGADGDGTPTVGSKRQQKLEKRGGQKVQYR